MALIDTLMPALYAAGWDATRNDEINEMPDGAIYVNGMTRITCEDVDPETSDPVVLVEMHAAGWSETWWYAHATQDGEDPEHELYNGPSLAEMAAVVVKATS
jgi:hypothetical protein